MKTIPSIEIALRAMPLRVEHWLSLPRSQSRARNAKLDRTHSHDHHTTAPSPNPCYVDRLSCPLIHSLSTDCAEDHSQSRGHGTQRWTERTLTILMRLHPRPIPATYTVFDVLSFHSLSTDCAQNYSQSRGRLKKARRLESNMKPCQHT